ncbi:MAG: DNA primase [Oscillospiraceae bacterium]|nr:DNA primase [Oscillospiraceae bacterium]
MLSEQFLQELKLRNDIEGVISSYVPVKRRGRNLVCLCPFHNEKSPSFTVYPDNQSFYCFGCGTGGDVITFIRRVENLEYIEAVKLLADRAGLAMPEDGYDDRAARMKSRVLEANRETARFYFSCLMSPMGKQALEYLRGRGLSDATIRRFGLGFAPDSWDMTLRHLTQKGFTREELAAACIAVQSSKDKTRYFDQFRGRVMFPIIDIRGNVIAFGGRIMGEGGPKYLNSPDTPVFKKSRNLFALNLAKATKENVLILAEGYMDVIALHQGGFGNAVATLGTSLTSEQARLISQYANTVVIAYDSDGAGQAATKRAINIFGEIGLKVKVLSMTGAKDPDEYIKKYGSQRFKLLIDGSDSAMNFEIEKIRSQYDLDTAEGKVAYLKDFVAFMAGISSEIERDVYISRTAEEMRVEKSTLLLQVDHAIRQRTRSAEKKQARDLSTFAVDKKDRSDPERSRNIRAALAEERLIAILFKNPDYRDYLLSRISPEEFITAFNRQVFSCLCDRLEENESLDMIALSAVFDQAQMGRISGIIAAADGQNFTRDEAEDYIKVIKDQAKQKTPQELAQMNDQELKQYIAGLAGKKPKATL